jgi:hypothetical protein
VILVTFHIKTASDSFLLSSGDLGSTQEQAKVAETESKRARGKSRMVNFFIRKVVRD